MKKFVAILFGLTMLFSVAVNADNAARFPQAGDESKTPVVDDGARIITSPGDRWTKFLKWDNDAFNLYCIDSTSITAAAYWVGETSFTMSMTCTELGTKTTSWYFGAAQTDRDTMVEVVDFFNGYKPSGLRISYELKTPTETYAGVEVNADSITFHVTRGLTEGTTDWVIGNNNTLAALANALNATRINGHSETTANVFYGTFTITALGDTSRVCGGLCVTADEINIGAGGAGLFPLDNFVCAGEGWVASLAEGTYDLQKSTDLAIVWDRTEVLDSTRTLNIEAEYINYMYYKKHPNTYGYRNYIDGYRLFLDNDATSIKFKVMEANTNVVPEQSVVDVTESVMPAGLAYRLSLNTSTQFLIESMGTSTTGYMYIEGRTGR